MACHHEYNQLYAHLNKAFINFGALASELTAAGQGDDGREIKHSIREMVQSKVSVSKL